MYKRQGLGFPDINTIEPLADALGLSVLEVMRSERIVEAEISPDKMCIRDRCMTAWGFIVEKRAYVASITLKST